jgi:hypothetical protein
MADKKTAVKRKVRATAYEPKVKFDGTLEDLIKIAVKPINTQPKTENK